MTHNQTWQRLCICIYISSMGFEVNVIYAGTPKSTICWVQSFLETSHFRFNVWDVAGQSWWGLGGARSVCSRYRPFLFGMDNLCQFPCKPANQKEKHTNIHDVSEGKAPATSHGGFHPFFFWGRVFFKIYSLFPGPKGTTVWEVWFA